MAPRSANQVSEAGPEVHVSSIERGIVDRILRGGSAQINSRDAACGVNCTRLGRGISYQPIGASPPADALQLFVYWNFRARRLPESFRIHDLELPEIGLQNYPYPLAT